MIALAAAVASGTPANSTSSLSQVEPGVLGFLVVAGIGLALVFLLRNMNKQFRKLGPPPEETDAESKEANTVGEAAATGRVRTGDSKQDERAEGASSRRDQPAGFPPPGPPG